MLDFGGDVPSEVRDGEDVLAALDDDGEERRPEQVAHPRQSTGPDAGDLAHFAVDGAAAHEHAVVDHDVHDRVAAFGELVLSPSTNSANTSAAYASSGS